MIYELGIFLFFLSCGAKAKHYFDSLKMVKVIDKGAWSTFALKL